MQKRNSITRVIMFNVLLRLIVCIHVLNVLLYVLCSYFHSSIIYYFHHTKNYVIFLKHSDILILGKNYRNIHIIYTPLDLIVITNPAVILYRYLT